MSSTNPAHFVLSLQEKLAESQWWPLDKLVRGQFDELNKLLDHARRTVPFYRERFQAIGLMGHVGPEDWRRSPMLTRRDVQRYGRDLQSHKIPESHGETLTTMSSGSTGMPVTVLGTIYDATIGKAITFRNHLWHDRDFSKTFAAIEKCGSGEADYPDGRKSDRWGDVVTFPFPTGPSVRLDIGVSVEKQVEWLQRQNPDYFLTYPSNLLNLAEHCQKHGVDFPNLAQVLTKGEIVASEVRDACRQAWGVRVVDAYSAQEVGAVALQCPEQEHYHVQSERALVEVLDEDGCACAPGEIGAVTITPLHNFAMPLIRYQIGDYVEVGESCPCGRGLPVLKRILGRVRNTLITVGGERYWPSFGTRRFTEIAPITQHQFVQTSLTAIEARLVTERSLTREEETALRAHILSRLPCPFDLSFTYHDEIPRSVGGKFEDFLSEVPE